jgi:hypothetical protein
MNALIEKYWTGEASLSEEQEIKQHFEQQSQVNSPDDLYFRYIREQQKIKSSRTTPKLVPLRSKISRLVVPIAASLLILAGVMWSLDYKQTDNNIVIDDPELALEITREAFGLINGKVKVGEQKIKDNINHLDKTLIFKNL